jgi:hypothetical protein
MKWNEIRNNSNRCYRNDNWTTKKKQKKYYSGKKRRHTLKTQIVADKKTKIIICTAFSTGKTHDFNLFKISKLPINRNIKANLDSGYQGIYNFHKNSKIPKKKTKLHPLTKEDKANNHKISKQRIFIENIIGAVKKFAIVSLKYRNRRKRFALRFNLLAGIYNFELII